MIDVKKNLIDTWWLVNENFIESQDVYNRPFARDPESGLFFSQITEKEFSEFCFSGKLPQDIINHLTKTK